MQWIITVLLMLALIFMSYKSNQLSKENKAQKRNDKFDYTKGYKSRWMFTPHEKDGYNKIKKVTDKLGLTLFAKVRLYDLVEPKPGVQNAMGHVGKIQAKHCDFVVCSEKLVAKAVIELDDASHDTAARQERDTFVDTVLQSCGYKVIHMREIDQETLETQLTEFAQTRVKASSAPASVQATKSPISGAASSPTTP